MKREQLSNYWESFRAGELSAPEFAELVFASEIAEDAEGLCIDRDRGRRCGHGEVIYGQGKRTETVVAAVARVLENHREALVTRASAEHREAIEATGIHVRWSDVGRTLRASRTAPPLAPEKVPAPGQADRASTKPLSSPRVEVAIVSAGTTDASVAYEAAETLAWMGVSTRLIQDVGVAGPYRLLGYLPSLRSSKVVIVVAGMEAALASVVGGQVRVPVIAVPTSVGYGANFGGMAALLGMINSCAANVSIVNIDAGFKAGYLAGLIARPYSESVEQ